ncbi:hypothetical protein Tco_1472728 [Tanacetum coccineum]
MQECTCAIYDKFLERDSHLKLIQFLIKLNDEYESVRSQILAMYPLPNVNKAYYIVQQIEKQKKSRGETRVDQKKSCTNYGQEGHVFEKCFERIGYPDWYKGKKAKKNARIAAHVNSGFKEMISGDTPFDLSSENDIGMGQNSSVDQRLVAAVCSEMMKMFKGKGIVDDNNGTMRNYATTSAHAGIMSYFTISFALFCHPQMNIRLDWVTDTKASDHMTPHFNIFITTRYLSDPIMVHLPDGRSLKVTIIGEVALTPLLILSDVFYVPEFQLNLLSVGKLIQHKNLTAPFFQNDFMFQDLTTEEIVVVGKGSRCLYICKPMLDPTSFAASIE